MKKRIIKLILSSSPILITMLFIFMIPILMILDFFGVNITGDNSSLEYDGYVENNAIYADDYTRVANKYITNNKGYVSLERILYFYVCDDSFSFDELYNDNLDKKTNRMLPIEDVCNQKKYSPLKVCKENIINSSKQIKKFQSKPFGKPIKFGAISVTSFFKEQRIIMGTVGVHDAWDFGAPSKTPVYAVCDGTVEIVKFPYSSNSQVGVGYGNYIQIKCDLDKGKYKVLYGHLYPNSSKVKIGSSVKKGEHIAGVGTTGRSTGNHLHYEVSYKGKVIDGMSFVNFTY